MSIERFFATSESRQRLRTGPLARDIDGFAAWLSVEGYARPLAREKLRGLPQNLWAELGFS